MQLYTISRIEQYIVDALIASPEIPLSVNILRLADAIDREGVVQNTTNIVVRYVSSFFNVLTRIPLVYERALTFELNFSCQNYLTSSGHDFATQLLAGALNTLVNGVPGDAGVAVAESFTLQSEQFTGITEESQYTYTQVWQITLSETVPYVALDPCVQRGDCSQIFPGRYTRTNVPLAGVIDNEGRIFVPALPDGTCAATPGCDNGNGGSITWENELTRSGNMVYCCDRSVVFLPAQLINKVRLTWTGQYLGDDKNKIMVAITDLETKETIAEVIYCGFIDDDGYDQYLMRYTIGLWRSSVGNITNESYGKSAFEGDWTMTTQTGVLAIVLSNAQPIYTDPTNPQAKQSMVDGGIVIGVLPDVYIQVGPDRYVMVQQSPVGRGWIKQTSIEYTSINELWKLGCPTCRPDICP
jgi:hypothetical protein